MALDDTVLAKPWVAMVANKGVAAISLRKARRRAPFETMLDMKVFLS